MSDFNFSLEANTLRGALVCVAPKEPREYLKGVSIQPRGDVLAIVSTDGHRLFAARYAPDFGPDAVLPTEKFTIPADVLKRALAGYKGDLIDVRREGDTWFLGDITFKPAGGTFPEWARVFPSDGAVRESLGTVAQFDPAYMADMGKVAKALAPGKKPALCHVHHCGRNPALVTFPGRVDVVCLIMPLIAEDMPEADLLILRDRITGKGGADSETLEKAAA